MSAFSGFANITKVPELRKRVLFTLGMLAVYRVGVFVTIPGVDRNVMAAVVSKMGRISSATGPAGMNGSVDAGRPSQRTARAPLSKNQTDVENKDLDRRPQTRSAIRLRSGQTVGMMNQARSGPPRFNGIAERR